MPGKTPKATPRKRTSTGNAKGQTKVPRRPSTGTPKTPKRAKTTGNTSRHFPTPATEQPKRTEVATPRTQTPKTTSKLPTPETSVEREDGDATNITLLPTRTIAKLISKDKLVPVTFTHPSETFEKLSDIPHEILQAISSKLHELSNRAEKSDPTGQPLVWSESRRELCEALPYYKAYKGGGYTLEGIAHCFMFDNVAHARDYIDSNVIIARAGGGMGKETKDGPMVLSRDQDASAQVTAVARNIQDFRPIGIIAGQYLSNMQSKMAHRYQFLDWFKPTDIWCEKTNGHVAVRFRFEKLRRNEPSWWTPAGEMEEIAEVGEIMSALTPISSTCGVCGRPSMQVYLNGWMCLREKCNKFWLLADGRAPVDDELKYDPRFLKRRTHWPHNSIPWTTKPDPFEALGKEPTVAGDADQEELGELTKSIVCPKCGRCTAAKYWTYWLCGNPSCQHRVVLPQENITRSGLRSLANPISAGYSFSKDVYTLKDEDSHVRLTVSFVGNYRVQKYTIDGLPDAFIAHMIANKTIVEETGGPDDMFMDLQNNEIGLERRAKDDTRIAGENLCDHYTLNFGMSYKFVASPDSKPFEDAPQAVKTARSQMIWAAKALGITEPDFNELMVLGYKTANKIGFHDDGEEGLGPTVATLSVGCEAEMKLKIQEKHFKGFTGSGFVDSLPPLPGGPRYKERLVAYHELKSLEATGDKLAYVARKKAVPKVLNLTSAKRKNAPEILKMRLNHGDIVIMHGESLQKYFLHCVEPRGRRRFAFTCRNILEHHLTVEEMPGYEVGGDEIGYDGDRLPKPE